MQTQELDWGDGYRELGREALAAITRSQMAQAIDEHLDRVALPMRPTGATGLIGAIC